MTASILTRELGEAAWAIAYLDECIENEDGGMRNLIDTTSSDFLPADNVSSQRYETNINTLLAAAETSPTIKNLCLICHCAYIFLDPA